MALLGWRCSWCYWESPHWNGNSMGYRDWLHWDSTESVLLKQWHWDGLAGMVALGLPWDDFTGMVAPGQPWNNLGTRAVRLALQMALPGWHQSGLPSTCGLSLSPHNFSIRGFRDPNLLSCSVGLWAQGR